jgi:hypothetical protein
MSRAHGADAPALMVLRIEGLALPAAVVDDGWRVGSRCRIFRLIRFAEGRPIPRSVFACGPRPNTVHSALRVAGCGAIDGWRQCHDGLREHA